MIPRNYLSVIGLVVFGVLGYAQGAVGEGWEDVSTLADGVHPTACKDEAHHCVFRHSSRMFWTMVSEEDDGSGPGGLADYRDSLEGCQRLNRRKVPWGGHQDWRLPTLSEVQFVAGDLVKLSVQAPLFKLNAETFYWTRTRLLPALHPFLEQDQEQDPEKAWAFRFGDRKLRQFPRVAKFLKVCVRDEFSNHWEDVSRKSDGYTKSSCLEDGDQCVLEDKREKLWWTERTPGIESGYLDKVKYDVAANACETLSWGGATDWRLPEIWEIAKANSHGLGITWNRWEHFGHNRDTESPNVMDLFWSKTQPINRAGRFVRPIGFPWKYTEREFESLYLRDQYYAYTGKHPFVCVRKAAFPDDDDDTVLNSIDKCPNTPKGAPVWKPGMQYPDGSDGKAYWGCAPGQIPTAMARFKE